MPKPETVRDFRREQILLAARALVSEGGLKALTYAALEQRLSFSRGVITHHFADKDDILQNVLRAALDEIGGATDDAGAATAPPEERIRRTLRLLVDGFRAHPQSARIFIAYLSAEALRPHADTPTARLLDRWRGQVAEILRDGVDRGALRYHDTEAMAAVIVGMVLGAVLQDHLAPGAVSVSRVGAAGTESVLAALRA